MKTYIPKILEALDAYSEHQNQVFDVPEHGELAVILCHFNPCAYEAPALNLQRVLKWLYAQNLPTYAVELRCGLSLNRRPVLPMGHSRVLQLTSASSLFRKDNLWNVAVRMLPARYRFVLCLDADSLLLGDEWQARLLQALQRRRIVQPFTTALWTDSAAQAFKEKRSCGFGYANGFVNPHISHHFHPGFAVAVWREFWEHTTGFYNSPVGGGSLFFLSAVMGLECETEAALAAISQPFLQHYRRWAEASYSWAEGSFGVIDAEAVHLWHGSRQKRQYASRFGRLKGFVPEADIEATSPHGLDEWSPSALANKREMVRSVEEYFLTREEDERFVAT